MKPDVRKRLADSVETAVALAEGIVEVELVEDAEGRVAEESQSRTAPAPRACASRPGTLVFSEKFSCLKCGTSMPELEPRIFSFNSPHGACPRCTGLGSQMEIDPDLAVDPSLTINEGAILPWSSGADYYEQLAQAIAEKYEIDLDMPWEDLSQEDQDLFLYGEEGERVYVSYRNRMGRRRSYMAPLEGVVPSLERRYLETDSEYSRERIEEYMSVRPCPECHGARLRPETPRGAGRRARHPRVHAQVGARGDRVARRARAERDRAPDRVADPEGDRGAAAASSTASASAT